MGSLGGLDPSGVGVTSPLVGWEDVGNDASLGSSHDRFARLGQVGAATLLDPEPAWISDFDRVSSHSLAADVGVLS